MLIQEDKKLSNDVVNVFFEQDDQNHLSDELVEEMSHAMHSIKNTVNDFDPKKRFFILETMDFFSSKISIGKLIPALMALHGVDQKRVIFEFFSPTFVSINSNVEILVSTAELFNLKTIHLDRGSLYLFVSDIAKTLKELFIPQFLAKFPETRSPVELLLSVISAYSKAKGKEKLIFFRGMINDEVRLRKIVLSFIKTLQTHDALYDYSIKRHSYYKLFLMNLIKKDRFQGIDPVDVSRITAGCFLGNRQLVPDEALIENMLHETMYIDKNTLIAKKKFLDSLSPTMVFDLIMEFRNHLQNLSKGNFGNEFGFIQKLSVKNILRKVWTNIVKVTEISPESNAAFGSFMGKIKKNLVAFVDFERKTEPKDVKAKAGNGVKQDLVVPKDNNSLSIVQKNFTLVETDVIAFRGEYEGGSQKDFAYNSRFFKQDDVMTMKFRFSFEQLYQVINKSDLVQTITYKKQRNIKEFYAAYEFFKGLICIGVTHKKTTPGTLIQENELFPYIIYFKETPEKQFGRVLSREAEVDGQLKYYSEESLTPNNAIYYYESIYHFFHLLPEPVWKGSDCQACIRFLVKEIQKISKGGGNLMFCVEPPELPQ
ncbi:MAG: hypothetical protein OEY59_07825 [Deltaproteobacteria bacterium]|nr:hypothetical protein [Deltaproteobacteria bacterium]